ncbi:MAG: DnaA regulatory inactivator Hda [Proteobacteria bacterium]|nr:DnaA regulatory inactivator Hda [Pseudomonadota bacterium]MBT6674785.1 DnaA regulatory inactivator Hda [Pseudomonadota bacterium]MBT7626774.1 DnaA regulatory inactivator Hda [Pseudomonadota bacterium]
MISQLTLDLYRAPHHEFERYMPGVNLEILSALKAWRSVSSYSSVYLWGGRGTGKSHLLEAAVREANRLDQRAIYLPVKTILPNLEMILCDLTEVSLVAIDDVDLCCGIHANEEKLFHLYNELKERGGRLLLSSTSRPDAVGFDLQDLTSRFREGLAYQLRELPDGNKTELLVKEANIRGLDLPQSTVNFIMRNYKRDMVFLMEVLALLDAASLEHSRSLTIPFVREFLKGHELGT